MQGWKYMWTPTAYYCLLIQVPGPQAFSSNFTCWGLWGCLISRSQTSRCLVPWVGNRILKNLFCPFTGTLNTALWILHSSGINWINLPCAWNTIWNSKSRPAILLVCPRKRSKNSPSCSSKLFRLVRSPRWTLYMKCLVRVELASVTIAETCRFLHFLTNGYR